VDSVHRRWTTARVARSSVDQRRCGHGDVRVSRRTHQSSASSCSGAWELIGGVEKREGSTGIPSQASPGLGWRCGGRATAGKELGCGSAQAWTEGENGVGRIGGGGSLL
jgi:hypothetical protein